MIAVLAPIALAGALPAVDAAKVCRDAQASALHRGCARSPSTVACATSRRRAKNWRRAGHIIGRRAPACLGDGGGVALSNVELWTCLQMQPGGSLSLQSSDRDVAPDFGLIAVAAARPAAPRQAIASARASPATLRESTGRRTMDQRAPHGSNWTMQAILCAGVVIWRSFPYPTLRATRCWRRHDRRSRAG